MPMQAARSRALRASSRSSRLRNRWSWFCIFVLSAKQKPSHAICLRFWRSQVLVRISAIRQECPDAFHSTYASRSPNSRLKPGKTLCQLFQWSHRSFAPDCRYVRPVPRIVALPWRGWKSIQVAPRATWLHSVGPTLGRPSGPISRSHRLPSAHGGSTCRRPYLLFSGGFPKRPLYTVACVPSFSPFEAEHRSLLPTITGASFAGGSPSLSRRGSLPWMYGPLLIVRG
jgi:hypothetical protein